MKRSPSPANSRGPAPGREDCLIPDAVIQEVRERVDIVAVIGRHLELKKSGRTFKGNCVFHGEKTPSFHVYPEDKHFKCYGCGAYGDVFAFLQKLEGKEFPEVVKELAQEMGIEIPEASEEDSEEAKARRKERGEITLACEAAARYWAARLKSRYGEGARAYLTSRGVSEESIQQFRLGVSAQAWNDLSGRLKEKGVGEAALLKAGLLIKREKGEGAYDRFRGRLMFPIASFDGQVIGFGGRLIPGEGQEQTGAKYINISETPLYKKSRVLYGLDLSRERLRKTRTAVLVEGYLDVIGLHQVGVTNAMAVCGTALTAEHVELLMRCDCREVVILFDGDPAGLAAPAKAAEVLFPAGLTGRVAVLPSPAGKTDPDDYAREHGRAGVEAVIAAAVPLSEFLIERSAARFCGDRPEEAPLEGKLSAVRELEPFLRMMPEGLARSVFEDGVARRLRLDPGALKSELAQGRQRRPGERAGAVSARPAQPVEDSRRERPRGRVPLYLPGPAADALGLLAAFPELWRVAEEEGLPQLLPPGPLCDLAKDLCQGPLAPEEVLARVTAGADAVTARRVKDWVGPGRPKPETAERELLRALIKTRIEAVRGEQDRVLKEVARSGKPVPLELTTQAQVAARRRADLEKRLRALERPV